jgi:hypothetical protein
VVPSGAVSIPAPFTLAPFSSSPVVISAVCNGDWRRSIYRGRRRCVHWLCRRIDADRNADAYAFGYRKDWQLPLINMATQCEAEVAADWKTYCEAYDNGVFKLTPKP